MPQKTLYWTDQIANELSKWKVKSHVVNDSKTPSGRIHIGALRGIFIHDAIFRSLRDNGLTAKIFYGWDDMDALDTVPSYLDRKKFSKFIGMPLFKIPSPEDGHKNFAEFFASEIIEVMKDTGCAAKHYKMSEMYKKGKMNKVIKTALENAEKVRQVFKEISGSEKGAEWLPFQVICENCGKISTTIATSFDGKFVKYKCKSPVQWATGCGYEGRISPFNGNGKLPWKVEWAARWPVLGVTVEGAGKDHYTKGGTRFVANRLSEIVFDYKHPYDLPYEWFYIGGKKMSSSKGVGASAKDIASVTTPEVLRFLMIKTRPQTAIDFDPHGKNLLRVFDDYEFHESVYFKKKTVKDKKELNNIKRVYELSQVSKVPREMKVHAPSRIMLEILKILPEKNKVEFTIKKLQDFGYIKKSSSQIKKEIKVKLEIFENLKKYFKEPVEKIEIELDEREKRVIRDLISAIKSTDDAEELQEKIFEVAKEHKINYGEFFRMIYKILLNADRGPRLGPYILQRGKEEVIKKLETSI